MGWTRRKTDPPCRLRLPPGADERQGPGVDGGAHLRETARQKVAGTVAAWPLPPGQRLPRSRPRHRRLGHGSLRSNTNIFSLKLG